MPRRSRLSPTPATSTQPHSSLDTENRDHGTLTCSHHNISYILTQFDAGAPTPDTPTQPRRTARRPRANTRYTANAASTDESPQPAPTRRRRRQAELIPEVAPGMEPKRPHALADTVLPPSNVPPSQLNPLDERAATTTGKLISQTPSFEH